MPPTEPPSASTSTNSDVSSPVMTTPSTHGGHITVPRLPIDMLIGVLENVDNPANFQPEVRMNVCSLFLQIGRNASGADELPRVKESVKPVLEKVLESLHEPQGKEEMLVKSVKRVLDAWA